MKPSIPKGTRDFLPQQIVKRNYIFDTVKQVFVKYGFSPIETPAMEALQTLTGKYGEEGDQLLFKVLNNGNYLSKADKNALESGDSAKLTASISKRGLRYDLTIPFARYVVMHQNDIAFPFKRYQIQPVWRADRPQKGRYQEFYQCDVDVVGSDSLMYESEYISIYDEVFAQLGLKVDIKINNRKILFGLAECCGIADKFMEMTIAIDKLDKIGKDGVKKEMAKADIDESVADRILTLLDIKDIDDLEKEFSNTETGLLGIQEIKSVFEYLNTDEITNKLTFDISLARGLNYYTGCIFEVAADTTVYPDLVMGSIGGGGRYADLTGVFGMKNMSGVGVSFGAERIYDVLEELNLFPQTLKQTIDVLIVSLDEASHKFGFQIAQQLRKENIVTDIYPEAAKMKKQMKFANDIKTPYVIIIGDQERESGLLALKNMETGDQDKLNVEAIIDRLKS